MNLKEAARYGKFLNDMIYVAQITSTSNDYIKKTIETHNKSKFNSEDEDEVIEITSQDKLNIKSNNLIYLAKDLIEEKLMLNLAIQKSKSNLSINLEENDLILSLDEAISYNKQLRSLISSCNTLNKVKSTESKRKEYGYKFNVEGNQVSYQYEVIVKKDIDFDKKEVYDLSKILKGKTDKISTLIDQSMTKDIIDFVPKYDINDSFEEIVEYYMQNNTTNHN